MNFGVNTINAINSAARITEIYHEIAYLPDYFSTGSIRNESHCIFHYTISGSGETWVGDKHYRTAPGVGFLNIIDDTDSGYCYPRDAADKWEFVVICFNFGNSRELTRELINTHGPLFKIDIKNEFIQNIICGKLFMPEKSFTMSENQRLLSELMYHIMKDTEKNTDVQVPQLIQDIKDLVSSNIEKNIGVSEIAAILDVSREHISREFYKYTGTHLKNYITNFRTKHICSLLKNTDLKIREISEKMNFNSTSNFISYFKKNTNQTPRQFKESNNNFIIS